MGNGASKCKWRNAPEARGGFWEFWRKLVELRLDTEQEGWLSPRPWAGVVRDWKSQNRKNVYLSPYVEEPLNSKLTKSFVPELRSRYVLCIFVFRDPMFYVYVMNIPCTFHIAISWLWYNIMRRIYLTNTSKLEFILMITYTVWQQIITGGKKMKQSHFSTSYFISKLMNTDRKITNTRKIYIRKLHFHQKFLHWKWKPIESVIIQRYC